MRTGLLPFPGDGMIAEWRVTRHGSRRLICRSRNNGMSCPRICPTLSNTLMIASLIDLLRRSFRKRNDEAGFHRAFRRLNLNRRARH